MKNLKRIMALGLVSVMVMGMTGCGKKEVSNESLAPYVETESTQAATTKSTMTTKYKEGYNFDVKDTSWRKQVKALAEGTTEYQRIINYVTAGKLNVTVGSTVKKYTSGNGTVIAFNEKYQYGTDIKEDDVAELCYKAQYMFNAEYDSSFTSALPAWSEKQSIADLKADNDWMTNTSVAYNDTLYIAFYNPSLTDNTLCAFVQGIITVNGTATNKYEGIWTSVGKTETTVSTTGLSFKYDAEKGWVVDSKVGASYYDYKTQYPIYENVKETFKNF